MRAGPQQGDGELGEIPAADDHERDGGLLSDAVDRESDGARGGCRPTRR